MIIRGGENVAPVAIEQALTSTSDVAEVAVFGLPHPDLGEEVMAIVVVVRDVTAEALKEQLRSSLASFAVPSCWRIQRERLPSTTPEGSTRPR